MLSIHWAAYWFFLAAAFLAGFLAAGIFRVGKP